MLTNYLAAALRNLARNRLHALLNIVGLTVGFAAAIFALLYVRDEFGFDRWIPGHEQVYRASPLLFPPGRAPLRSEPGPAPLAQWLEQDFPQVEAAARLSHPMQLAIRRGPVEANEILYWADPDFLDVIRLPVVAGDPRQALDAPDGLVMTRTLARKYFGRDEVVGQPVELIAAGGRATMRVLAVLEDLPSNTHLDFSLLASARAPFSEQSRLDANPDPADSFNFRMHTYLRLAKGADAAQLRAAMPQFLKRHISTNPAVERDAAALEVLPLAAIHFAPAAEFIFKPRGNRPAVYSILLVGGLIVLIALINFVNLTTARAARRGVEVGVRKAAGASRRVLFAQFMGESLLYCLAATTMAIALVELLLPFFNAFLQRTMRFDYWMDPWLAGGLAAMVLLSVLAGGAYPAFVLTGFAPGRVLKQARASTGEKGLVRGLLVVMQFAILIALIICAATVFRQTHYAMNAALRLDKDLVLLIEGGCTQAFEDKVAALQGVRSTGCVSREALDMDIYTGTLTRGDLPAVQARRSRVGFGFFESLGLSPVAGRTFSRSYGADQMPPDQRERFGANIILNEAAARAIGFANPADAVGQSVRTTLRGPDTPPSNVIGVVPDFHLAATREAVGPSMYFVDLAVRQFLLLSVKLDGSQLPETLRAIDAAWVLQDNRRPINRRFLDRHVQDLYAAQERQSVLLTILSGIAISIAVLGLFGLAMFATERRTKEIGIRKALGATSTDVVRLLLWQFSRPVLWANLIAWPVAAWLMQRWLAGFAYRIDLPIWLFPVAGALALLIALATVATHSILVARAKPVSALRYE